MSNEQHNARFKPDDVCRDRIKDRTEYVIDAIEETFLAHLPSKALSYCAQEDVNAGLDAMRERFSVDVEPGPMTPRKPPRLVVSGLTGRIYVTTSYREHGDGMIEALTKFDVTDEFELIESGRAIKRAAAAREPTL